MAFTKFFYFFLALCLSSLLLASEPDSLSIQHDIDVATTSEKKVKSMIELARYFLSRNVEKSITIANSAEQLSIKNKYNEGKADAICMRGEANYLLANYEDAKVNFTEALSYYDKTKHPIGVAESYEGLGKVAYKFGDFDASLTHYSEALEIFEKHNYKNGLAGLYINLGLLYDESLRPAQAIDFYKKALKISQEINDQISEASAYTNLGSMYNDQGNHDLAIECLEKSIVLKKQNGNKKGEATSLNNLGATYYQMGNMEKALECFQGSYDIYNQINDTKNCFSPLNNLGSIYFDKKEFDKALSYYEKAYEVSQKLGSLSKEILCLESLALTHKELGNASQALDFSIQCSSLKDTLFNKDQAEITAEMQMRFASEKKQQENEILNLQVKSESFIKMIFIVVAGLLLVLAFFIFRGLKQKQKINKALEEKNKIIEEQKLTVEKQKHIVEEQNKDITDSIKYAERIQNAILPPDQLWYSLLHDSFVFYKPKDILSGDFYWVEQRGDLVFVAAADCTGHGVPGALISIVNYNLLNKAVLEKELNDPAEILNYVNNQLTVALHQTFQESSVRDGMDISLCVINTKTLEIHYAGANNPIYIVSENALTQLVANKFPVGAFVDEKLQLFTSQKMRLEKGDLIYLFSDGYADQFGGQNGKKLKYKTFKEILLEIHHLSASEQQQILANRFTAWKGNLEQVDDVLVIGIRV